MLAFTVALFFSLLHGKASADSTLTPPVLPLIVRNPYLSVWLGNARDDPWNKWPIFYTGEEIGLSVLAYIPESRTVYPLLGRPHDSLVKSEGKNGSEGDAGYHVSFPIYNGATYDASFTNLTYQIPNLSDLSIPAVKVTLSFISPITPSSTLRQSLPAAYVVVYVEGSFPINVYIDVNGQWVSGKTDSHIEWTHWENNSSDDDLRFRTWRIQKARDEVFAEHRDRAEWGKLYFNGPGSAIPQAGSSQSVRQSFAKGGNLNGEVDTTYRSIMDDEPVFAFSQAFELGKNTSASPLKEDRALFTLVHTQDPVVQFASARGLTFMMPLWKTWFSIDYKLTNYHYLDFANARNLAMDYSNHLALDAYVSSSENYVEIVALSARQVMGATSFSGTPDNPIIFLKEISSNGNCQTVDVIFPAFPFFLYTNPRWLAYLLEPLLEYQLSGQYPNMYAMHDLGYHFPNETGHSNGIDEYMPVEECGDMLIMGLALINSLSYDEGTDPQPLWSTMDNGDMNFGEEEIGESAFPLINLEARDGIDYLDDKWGGGAKGHLQAQRWLRRTYRLWKQWTGYLVEFSLEPHNQLSTDDFAGWLALQTNLALKGIIGIKAMSEMADILGETVDANYYRNISNTYIKRWEELGISRDKTHAKLAYNWYGSWTTLYSLFADAILCFHPSLTNPKLSSPFSSFSDDTIYNKSSNHSNNSNNNNSYYYGANNAQSPLKQQPNKPDLTKKQKQQQEHMNENDGDFIPHHIYTQQTTWYASVLQKYGLPLDSRHLYAKSDWELEAAAVVTSPSVRAAILQSVARWINETNTDRPLTDLYMTEGDGGFPGPKFFARPVVGAHFAFLALEGACGGSGGGMRMFEADMALDSDYESEDENEDESEDEDARVESVEWDDEL